MEEKTHKIIVLEELIAMRSKKQKELMYYREKLLELEEKMKHIQMDIDVTSIIINMIEEENVINIEKHLVDRN